MNPKILEISNQIDHIKEYIDSELCQKCEQMKQHLEELQSKLIDLSK